jgi:hypothetical protein
VGVDGVAIERGGGAYACCWGRKPVGGGWRGEETSLSLKHHLLLVKVVVTVVAVAVAVVAVLVLCLLLLARELLGGGCDARGILVVQSPHLLLFLLDVLSLLMLLLEVLLLLLLLLLLDEMDLLRMRVLVERIECGNVCCPRARKNMRERGRGYNGRGALGIATRVAVSFDHGEHPWVMLDGAVNRRRRGGIHAVHAIIVKLVGIPQLIVARTIVVMMRVPVLRTQELVVFFFLHILTYDDF